MVRAVDQVRGVVCACYESKLLTFWIFTDFIASLTTGLVLSCPRPFPTPSTPSAMLEVQSQIYSARACYLPVHAIGRP